NSHIVGRPGHDRSRTALQVDALVVEGGAFADALDEHDEKGSSVLVGDIGGVGVVGGGESGLFIRSHEAADSAGAAAGLYADRVSLGQVVRVGDEKIPCLPASGIQTDGLICVREGTLPAPIGFIGRAIVDRRESLQVIRRVVAGLRAA